MSAIVPDGGECYAASVDTAAAHPPLPVDFLEFLEQRLGIDRAAAVNLLGSHLRAVWDLGCAAALPGIARCAAPPRADASSA
ncbi:MAG TPA: hypothetical protein VGK73_01815 [Polyangiaceae bacterium]